MNMDMKVELAPELLAKALEAIESRADPEIAPRLTSFARAMLARAPADFFLGQTDETLLEIVLSHFKLLEATPPDDVAVRVRQRVGFGHTGAAEIIIKDRPFVVDTLRQFLTSRGFEIRHELHPIVVVDRNEDGSVAQVFDWTAEGERFSIPYCEFEGHLDETIVSGLEEALRDCMDEVRVATDDFPAMVAKTDDVCEELRHVEQSLPDRAAEIEEIVAFLQWLKDEDFVYLGYRGYDFVQDNNGQKVVAVDRGSGLGILRHEEQSSTWEPTPLEDLPPDLRARAVLGPILIVSKTNSEARVHRTARMDYIGIKKLAENGEVIGEHRFLGLFTWKAYSEYSGNIPILRHKLSKLLETENVLKGSHDYRAFVQLFNDIPKEEVFLMGVDDLRKQIRAMMAPEDTGEINLVFTPDNLGRGVMVMVILPKQNYSDEVRGRLRREMAEVLGGTVLNDHLSLGEGDTARMHLYISANPERMQEIDVAALREHAASIAQTWQQRLKGALGDRHDVESVHRLEETYFDAFTPEYVATTDVDTAVEDIGRLEALERTGLMQVALEPFQEVDLDATELRLFVRRGTMILADTMPMLENLGLRVIEAQALDVEVAGRGATIHTFVVQGPGGRPLDGEGAGGRLSDTLIAVQSDRADSDRLNRLVVTADLSWEEVGVLRAYSAYAFQIGAVPSRRSGPESLLGYPNVARLLIKVFRAKFDPDFSGERGVAVGTATARFLDSLQDVESIGDDLNLRRLLNLVDATVRTSFFRNSKLKLQSPRMTFKIDCAAVEQMPEPRPTREMFVHSPRTAGAHLRFGAVARGGVRWSERPDDFRTELLGLAKTQQVKNTVIVPAGAKGAFYVRKPPVDRAELEPAVRESYREYIAALLDVTDNIVDGKVVHPPATVVYDDEDPYLVVAADKGTAAYSDIANEIAASYGFWLGDAFASGGSHGYDHKKEGITARGAWECVKQHFREMNKDVSKDPVTVVGIGDMSGDVFGNGMLLSRTLKLVAAFDHRHIFVDPDPDPEQSFEERLRLFQLPRSSWKDYDTTLISEAGGIFPRGAKEIQLSKVARDLFGLGGHAVNGQALIRAILRTPVELLWNGGIGTYVKAPSESHADVGDSSNDAVRIDANELGARVVGEGGNLGLTQLARIEHALVGGRLNTDAVDNSGGVDMSDHEVNLKILLGSLMERGELSMDERNALLVDMTEAVVEMVLANNRSQGRALSLEQLRAADRLSDFRDASYFLEQRVGLKRAQEFLPGWGRLQARQESGKSLTRPELAVLMAYSKLHLKREILRSTLPDDPALAKLLRAYFPPAVAERVSESDLRGHRLQREVIATVLTNRLIDLMGSTFIPRVTRDTGAKPAAVARGWFVAAEIAGTNELMDWVSSHRDRLSAEREGRWLLALEVVLERTVRWAVENLPEDAEVGRAIEQFKQPIDELCRILPSITSGSQHEMFEQVLEELKGAGQPSEAAERIAALQFLGDLMAATRIAADLGRPAADVGRVYFALSDEVDFALLLELLDLAPGEDEWEQRAAQGLMQDLGQARRNLTLAVLAAGAMNAPADEKLATFRERHASRLNAMREVLEELLVSDNVNLAALTVATREAVRHSMAILDSRR
jgi:glutamate dehydrogenase